MHGNVIYLPRVCITKVSGWHENGNLIQGSWGRMVEIYACFELSVQGALEL